MSEENVELVRRMMEARNRGDIDTVMTYAAPDIEFDLSASAGTFAGIYRGRTAVRRLWAAWSEVFSHMRWEEEEFIDAGDAVIVPVHFHARGRGSGAETVTRAGPRLLIRRAGNIDRQPSSTSPSAIRRGPATFTAPRTVTSRPKRTSPSTVRRSASISDGGPSAKRGSKSPINLK